MFDFFLGVPGGPRLVTKRRIMPHRVKQGCPKKTKVDFKLKIFVGPKGVDCQPSFREDILLEG